MTRSESRHLMAISPWMGVIPRSATGRVFLLWAMANVLMTLAPVFTTWLDDTRMILGVAPTTVFVSFLAFFSNCAMGAVYYRVRSRRWAATAN